MSLEIRPYIWELLLDHVRQDIAELFLKRPDANAVLLEAGPRFLALEEVILRGMPIECRILQLCLAGIFDH